VYTNVYRYLKKGEFDTCNGDIGGPLVINGTKIQVGIISWSDGCGKPGNYSKLSQEHKKKL